MRKTVLIHGTFFGNVGDVLMLHAAVNALRKHYSIKIHRSGGHKEQSHGTTTESQFPDVAWTDTYDDADAVVDVCGYWCGDPWGSGRVVGMAMNIERWKHSGKRVILLPQSFGPFKNPLVADAARRCIASSDLVCARDETSLRLIRELCEKPDHVRLFHDYTMDVAPVPGDPVPVCSVAVIPNLRMLDRSDIGKQKYIPLLGQIIRAIHASGRRAFFLIHESNDVRILALLEGTETDIPVFCPKDVRTAKWIVSRCDAVVTSRYHGLLNALYADTPCIALSWTHKFEELLSEWNMLDRLLPLNATTDTVDKYIRTLLSENSWESGRKNRQMKRCHMRTSNDILWQSVRRCIDDAPLDCHPMP